MSSTTRITQKNAVSYVKEARHNSEHTKPLHFLGFWIRLTNSGWNQLPQTRGPEVKPVTKKYDFKIEHFYFLLMAAQYRSRHIKCYT